MESAAEPHGAAVRASGGFFGHPRGLAYLVAVEGFWAFGYFGLQMLLTLYMTRQLMAPGHAEHVLGFARFRALLQGGGPPLGPVDIASQTYGLFTSASYALPLLGAFVADRWLGLRRTMVLGLVLLSLAMAMVVFEQGFLIGLALIAVGSGLLKCNLMVAIGNLYAPGDARRTSAFAMYLIFANIGSLSAPLVAGTLAEKVNYPLGLSVLAAGMALGLVAYLRGIKETAPAVRTDDEVSPAPGAWRGANLTIALALTALLTPEVLHFGAYNQTFNVFPLWATDHVDMRLFGFTAPVTWFNTLDGLLTIAGAAVTIRLWDWQAARGRPMADLTKMAVGSALGLAGFAILAAAALGPGNAPLAAAVGYFLCADPAIIWVDTVTMALVSRAAPAAINSTMMALYTMSVAGGYYITGQLGRLYEHMSPAAFWSVHAGLDVATLAFLALAGPPLARALTDAGGTRTAVAAAATMG
jgi:POT family proton-dependent oligopeptide transporter